MDRAESDAWLEPQAPTVAVLEIFMPESLDAVIIEDVMFISPDVARELGSERTGAHAIHGRTFPCWELYA